MYSYFNIFINIFLHNVYACVCVIHTGSRVQHDFGDSARPCDSRLIKTELIKECSSHNEMLTPQRDDPKNHELK